MISQTDISRQVRSALDEDIGSGDVTAALIQPSTQARANLICREQAILCGTTWFDTVFQLLDPAIKTSWHAADGDAISAGQIVCELAGPAHSILTGERTAMNFLQTLSGTATTTRHYVNAVEGTGCKILDTRKTIPGLRLAQKYAVACAGGENHRFGLYDAILIKENHIAACGSITAAVTQARTTFPQLLLEVEVETLQQLEEAISIRVDRILLDNMSEDQLKKAVQITQSRIKLEASGGITLDNIRSIAKTGVDFISIGSLTKHIHAVDLSLRLL